MFSQTPIFSLTVTCFDGVAQGSLDTRGNVLNIVVSSFSLQIV